MKTILTPIDFSSVTPAVLAEATFLACALPARIVLLTIVQPPTVVADYAPMMQDLTAITAAGEKAAAEKLARHREELRGQNLAVETIHLVGAPVLHILAEARRTRADYIVMGSHGHTALYDLLLGSTTHGVLKHAGCPVVIVPAKAAATPQTSA